MALVNGRSKLAKILAEKGRWRRSPVTAYQGSLAETGKDGSSQKAKQKRLISTISLFSLVFKRRATGEKAPSSAHRESAKSALFL